MSSDITTSDQLKKLIDSEHDLYKSEWDKKNVVQFKNERIAILENKHGSQVQFIVAFDQVTKEGYSLMGVSTPEDAGVSHFYFQKMK